VIGISVPGIEELLDERREVLEASAVLRARRQVAAEQVQRLADEVREHKSRTSSTTRERDELLADGSPEAQSRLRELRAKIGSSISELAAVEDELRAARRYFDFVRNDSERAGDRVARSASRIYAVIYRAFIAEATKRLGSELIAAIGTLRHVLRQEEEFFPKLSDDRERSVLIALKSEYLDPPAKNAPAPAKLKRVAAGR